MMVAHEVKNPLGIIRGAVDVLKKPEIPEATYSTMMTYVESELDRLNRLVEDFLRFARPRPPQLQKTNISELLMETIDRFYLESQNGPQRIQTDIPPEPLWIEVDVDLISQALNNVVKNALEASAPEGQVWVSASMLNGHFRIVVRDEGPGIPSDDREQIFEPFYTTKSQGTGLGLALVTRVIQQHGGIIEIMDVPEGGGCFQILLPVGIETLREPLNPEPPFPEGDALVAADDNRSQAQISPEKKSEKYWKALTKGLEAKSIRTKENWRKILWLISWL
jgi:signal transduction histidine kinase